jgi:hypothetical protein
MGKKPRRTARTTQRPTAKKMKPLPIPLRMQGTTAWMHDDGIDSGDVARAILRRGDDVQLELALTIIYEEQDGTYDFVMRRLASGQYHGAFHFGQCHLHIVGYDEKKRKVTCRGRWVEDGYDYDWTLDLDVVDKFED